MANLEIIGYLLTTTGYLLVPATLLFHGHPSRRKKTKSRASDAHFLERGMISYTWMSILLVLIGTMLHFVSQGWI